MLVFRSVVMPFAHEVALDFVGKKGSTFGRRMPGRVDQTSEKRVARADLSLLTHEGGEPAERTAEV
jgi:hypothetical protein